jgi:phospholipase/carboxylesterase
MNVITVPATGTPNSSPKSPQGNLVLLHGWGANSEDLAGLLPYLQLPNYQFLLPNGVFEHQYTATGRAWYSFTGAGQLTATSQSELAQSRQMLQDWLHTLPKTTGIGLDRTWIAGFSQGGAMALDLGLTMPVAGIMVLSGYLHSAPGDIITPTACPPVLICHGRQDEVVPIEMAWQARQQLIDWGAIVQYHELEMGHTIIPDEINMMRQLILNQSVATN